MTKEQHPSSDVQLTVLYIVVSTQLQLENA